MPLLDLFTDENGEISVAANGDLLVARDDDVLVAEALWRAKTCKGDWVLVPECGADLELLIGEPNTRDTGAQLEAQLSEALTNDGFFTGRLNGVRATPLNKDTIVASIDIDGIEANFSVQVPLNLQEGVL